MAYLADLLVLTAAAAAAKLQLLLCSFVRSFVQVKHESAYAKKLSNPVRDQVKSVTHSGSVVVVV